MVARRSCETRVCGIATDDGTRPRQRSLQRGELLELPSCRRLLTVLDGLMALSTWLPDGRRQILCLYTPGDLLCPMVSAGEMDVRVEALAPSRLCEIDLGASGSMVGEDGALAAELFRTLHSQMVGVSVHLVTLGRLDGMERVCLFLADMARRTGRRTPGGWRVHLPLNREDIADYLGLNAETVSRIFSRVKKGGLATFLSPTEYLVQDLEALQGRAPVVPPEALRWGGRADSLEASSCPA